MSFFRPLLNESHTTLLLTYDELLERKLGQYELILNVHPGNVLEKLTVKVGEVTKKVIAMLIFVLL